MYQLKMKGTAPKALIIKNPDTTLVASAIIMETPMVDRVAAEFYSEVRDGDFVEVDADQSIITIQKRGAES
jgi:predicted aconitase with swiveling domain